MPAKKRKVPDAPKISFEDEVSGLISIVGATCWVDYESVMYDANMMLGPQTG